MTNKEAEAGKKDAEAHATEKPHDEMHEANEAHEGKEEYKELTEDHMDEDEKKAYGMLASRGKYKIMKAEMNPEQVATAGAQAGATITPGTMTGQVSNNQMSAAGHSGAGFPSQQHLPMNGKGAEVDIMKSPLGTEITNLKKKVAFYEQNMAKAIEEGVKNIMKDRSSFMKGMMEGSDNSFTPKPLPQAEAPTPSADSLEKKLAGMAQFR